MKDLLILAFYGVPPLAFSIWLANWAEKRRPSKAKASSSPLLPPRTSAN
jgi:hypothetical protein